MRDWSPRRTWKWAWWCAGGTRCTSRAVGGPSVASVSFARHQAGRHLHIVAERGGGGCRSRTSASAHAAWGERHSPGSGRSATSSARVGWSGWACASVDGWFMEHVAGAGAGGDVAQSTAGGAGDAELVAGLLFILHRRCCYRLPPTSYNTANPNNTSPANRPGHSIAGRCTKAVHLQSRPTESIIFPFAARQHIYTSSSQPISRAPIDI